MSGHDTESLESDEPPAEGSAPRRWRKRHTLFAVLCVLALMALIASYISIPYYAITPGSAQPVQHLIGVPKKLDHHHKGDVLLVDVQLTPLRAIEWPYFWLDSNAEIVPQASLLGPENAQQYNTEGVLDMKDAQQAATVVALHTLGYKVSVHPDGALLYALLPGSPAANSLAVGDVVNAVNGHPVATAADLGARLRLLKPGDTAKMELLAYPSHKHELIRVRLSAWRIKGKGRNATLVCPPYGTDLRYPIGHVSPETLKRVSAAPCIGALNVETSYRVGKLPFRINLASEGIIGPSAGLAFTLGLIQQLDPHDLTGGLKVAATGTMSIDGTIGDVGGVAQKTVAVRSSGAKIFFVPPQEYKVAVQHGGGGLKIFAVSKISQAISILQHYGGKLPPAATKP